MCPALDGLVNPASAEALAGRMTYFTL
jgi:hypothetical protein